MTFRLAALVVFALCAFAANSLLCRHALEGERIDAASFTLVRLAAGAAMLWLLLRWPARVQAIPPASAASWVPAGLLFLYAIAFSLAYRSLTAATGALILFGAVQATMVGAGWWQRARPTRQQWLGMAVALGGLAWLVSPGLAAPPPGGALLMAIAGMAWGGYSLRGRAQQDPVAATARNFLRSVPFAVLAAAAMLPMLHVSAAGILLATASGALASALGYVAWYAVLPALAPARAATLQLAVPPLTAVAAVLLLGEPLTSRLIVAGAAILGGIALTIGSRPGAPRVP